MDYLDDREKRCAIFSMFLKLVRCKFLIVPTNLYAEFFDFYKLCTETFSRIYEYCQYTFHSDAFDA